MWWSRLTEHWPLLLAIDEDREQSESKTTPLDGWSKMVLSMKTAFSSAEGAGVHGGFTDRPGGAGLALFLLRQTVSK